MDRRSIIKGPIDVEVAMKQIHNGDHESVVLSRFPFHEAATPQAVLTLYRNAVQVMFQVIPEEHHIAVLGRFARKLVKRMQYLKSMGRL